MRTGEALFWLLFIFMTAFAMEAASAAIMPDRFAWPIGNLIQEIVAAVL